MKWMTKKTIETALTMYLSAVLMLWLTPFVWAGKLIIVGIRKQLGITKAKLQERAEMYEDFMTVSWFARN